MKRIRIGKDISMRWEITTDGVAIPLDGRDLTVEIKSPAGIENNIPYRIDGNILIMTYYGYEQKRTGEYSITLWEKKGKPGQNVVDVIRAFELVRTSQEENDFVGGDLQIESVDLGTGNFDILTEGGYRAINIDTLQAEALEDSVNIKGKTYSNESFTITLPKANLDSAGVMSADDKHTLQEHGNRIAQINTTLDEHTESINARITTDRIADGAVTSEKIATTAFDSTLSVSGKIAPADIVGNRIAQINTTLEEHTESINARITTDRISDGAVTSEKIATSAFDSTLSVSGKIAPADVVGTRLTGLEEKVGNINEDVFKKKVVPTLTFEEGVSIIASGIKNTGWPNSVLSSPFSLKKGETLHITCTNAANRYCIAFPKDDGNTFNVLNDSLTDGTEHSYEYIADKDCLVVISYFGNKNADYYISYASPLEVKLSELEQNDASLGKSIKDVDEKIGNLNEIKIVELEQKSFGDGRLKITNSKVVIDTTTLSGTWRHCYFDVTEGNHLHLKTRTAGGTNFWFIGTDGSDNVVKIISSVQSGATIYELDYVCESSITRIWMSCYTDGGDAQAKKSMSITTEKPVQISEVFERIDAKIDNLMAWKGKTVLFYGDSVTYVAQSSDNFAMKSGEAEYPYNIPSGSINWQKRVCEKLQIKKFYSRGIGGSKLEHEDWICYINNVTGAAVGNKETITDGTNSVTNHHAATNEAKELDFTWSHYSQDPSIAPDVNGYTKIHTGMSDWDRIRAMIPESIANTIDAVFVMCHNSRVDKDVTPSYLNSGCPDVYWENESLNTLGGDFDTSDSANAILSIIHKLQVRCPNAVIIVGTPISGYQYGLKPSTAATTNMSQAMADYTRAENIKKAAHLMASPVVDMFGTDGINPLNRNQYMLDAIHPFTENGSKALARACSSGLLTILPKL